MRTEKKKSHVGAKIAIIVIIAYLLLALIMTFIYSLFQEWIDIAPTGFTLAAYTELFTDPLFWKAVGRTVVISIIPIILCWTYDRYFCRADRIVYGIRPSGNVCGSCISSGMG